MKRRQAAIDHASELVGVAGFEPTTSSSQSNDVVVLPWSFMR